MERANLEPRPPEKDLNIVMSIRLAVIAFLIWLVPIVTCIYLILNSH